LADEVVDANYEEELHEFLEADLLPASVDPSFKARLREALLAMVRARQPLPPREGGEAVVSQALEKASATPPGEVDGVAEPASPRPPNVERKPR
jgi:hypothetical protein